MVCGCLKLIIKSYPRKLLSACPLNPSFVLSIRIYHYTRATALKLGKLIRDVYLVYFQGIQKKILHELWPVFPLDMHMVRSQCFTNTILGKNNFHVQGACINTLSKFISFNYLKDS